MTKEETALKVISVLVLISFFSAFLLAYVNDITRGPIEENKKAETKKAIGIVLNKLQDYTCPEEPIETEIEDSPVKYFLAHGANGAIMGYAIVVKGPNGFTTDLDIMVGLDSLGKIIDTYVLDHKETPGLGDGMLKEPFKKQFRNKSMDDTQWNVKKDGGDIDALTAATITSRAFVGGVRRALLVFKRLKEEQNI